MAKAWGPGAETGGNRKASVESVSKKTTLYRPGLCFSASSGSIYQPSPAHGEEERCVKEKIRKSPVPGAAVMGKPNATALCPPGCSMLLAGDEFSHWSQESFILFFPPHLGLDLYYDKATQSIALVCQISPLLSGVSVLLAKNTSSLPDGQGILQRWGTIESSCAARISERCN